MNPSSAARDSAVRRKAHYVDHVIQGSLLAALITLEILLVTASTWVMYRQLDSMIEENLYRVHLPEQAPMFLQLLQEASGILGMFVLINLLALGLAETIWSRYENAILADFMSLIAKTQALDFSSDEGLPQRHEVVTLTQAWRSGERQQLLALRAQLQALEDLVAKRSSPQELRLTIETMQRLLPSGK